MTFDDFIKIPISKRVVLFEIDEQVDFNNTGWVKEENTIWKTKISWENKTVNTSYGDGSYGYGSYGSSETVQLPTSPDRLNKIKSIIIDGEQWIEVGSYEDVFDISKSFYFDVDNQILYLNTESADIPPNYYYNFIKLGSVRGISNKDGYIDDIFYEGRIKSLSAIKETSDDMYFGKIPFNTGTIKLINIDGYFDDLYIKDYYGSEVRLYFGGEGVNIKDYIQIYNGYVEDFNYTSDSITIKYKDSRDLLTNSLPENVFEKSIYPNLNENNEGEFIPITYGRINKGKAVCINSDSSLNKKYKFADTSKHKIKSVIKVYEVDDNLLEVIDENDYTVDLDNGIIETNDNEEMDIYVDFEGYVDENGNLINTPIDVIQDLLENYANISYSDSTFVIDEWEAARSYFNQEIYLYIKDEKEIIDVISSISNSTFGMLKINNEGKITYKIFDIEKETNDKIYIDEMIALPSINMTNKNYLNSARVGYNYNFWKDDYNYIINNNLKEALFYKYKKHNQKTFETVLKNKIDAENYSTFMVNNFGDLKPYFTITTTLSHIKLEVFDTIELQVDQENQAWIKGVILSKTVDIFNNKLTFTIKYIKNLQNVDNILDLLNYDNQKTYSSGDLVYSSGSIYRAIKLTNGNAPYPNSEFWELFMYTANDDSVGPFKYNGFSKEAGTLYGGTSTPDSTVRLNYDGYFYATRIYNAVYYDYAEKFEVDGERIYGRIYTVNPDTGHLILTNKNHQKPIGISSNSYGFLLKDQIDGIEIGLAGTVKLNITGKINPGDYIVSTKDGYGKKANIVEKIFFKDRIVAIYLKNGLVKII
jgi:hypothetical protein